MGDIPVITINSEEEENTYLREKKGYIHVKILENIGIAYENDIESLELLKVVNNFRGFTFVLCVTKDSWVDSLEKCLAHFLNVEEYEYCGKVNELLEKIKNGNT